MARDRAWRRVQTRRIKRRWRALRRFESMPYNDKAYYNRSIKGWEHWYDYTDRPRDVAMKAFARHHCGCEYCGPWVRDDAIEREWRKHRARCYAEEAAQWRDFSSSANLP